MVCRTCGRQVSNETANFCEYCGTSLRQIDDPFEVYSKRQEQSSSISSQEGQKTNRFWFGKEIEDGKEPVVTFSQWLLLMVVLPLIPVVGPFIYFVVLFILGFGKNVPGTLKNWARVILLMLLIGIVFFFSMAGQLFERFSGAI